MRNMITLLLPTPIAKSLADAGLSKQDVREYLYENARVPLRELEGMTKYTFPEVRTVREKVELGIYPKEFWVGPDELVRVLANPDIIHIVVCGDPGRNRVMTLWSGYVQPTTKEINLPANWGKLIKENHL